MKKTLPTFTQYMNFPTREERTLDLMYANREEVKKVHRELKVKIKDAKDTYWRKLEGKLSKAI